MDEIPGQALPTAYNLGVTRVGPADEETALRAFDAYFLGELLRRSAPQNPSGLFDGGQAGRMYQDHLYQELGRIIAENGDFGMASSLVGKLVPTSPDEAPDGREEDE